MKQAYYVENAFWRSRGTEDIKRALLTSAAAQGLALLPRTNADFLDAAALVGGPRAALFWDKDLRLAQGLERRGLQLFNSAEAIRLCDDKTLTYLALAGTGIPMPDTLLCPMSFPGVGYGDHAAFLDQVAQQLGLPFVLKEGCGSFGQQVYLVEEPAQALDVMNRAAGAPMLFQRFISESAGRDLRLYVVGGQVVASMMRVGEGDDFRANIAGGGRAEKHAATAAEERIALDACAALGLDFGGVDLLLSRDGPLLCEVNSNAHFGALRELTGVNPADHIIAWMKENMP